MNKADLMEAVNIQFGLGTKGKASRKHLAAQATVNVFHDNIGKMSPHDMLDEVKYTMGVNFIVWWLIRQFVWQVIVFLYHKYYGDV